MGVLSSVIGLPAFFYLPVPLEDTSQGQAGGEKEDDLHNQQDARPGHQWPQQ